MAQGEIGNATWLKPLKNESPFRPQALVVHEAAYLLSLVRQCQEGTEIRQGIESVLYRAEALQHPQEGFTPDMSSAFGRSFLCSSEPAAAG